MRSVVTAALCLTVGILLLAAAPMEAPLPYLQVAATEPPVEAVAQVQGFQLPAEELAARAMEGRWILLRTGSFDPLNEGPPAFARAEAGTATRYALVQFTRDLTENEWKAFKAQGASLIDYIPSHAYLVRMANEGAVAALLAHPDYRWHGPYSGGYKINPLLSSSAWRHGVFVDATLFPNENPVLIKDKMLEIEPAAVIAAQHNTLDEGAMLRFFVPGEYLHPFVEALADQSAVKTVEPWFLPHTHNDNSVYVIQSYDTANKLDYGVCATLWNHGITGTGQLPAVADTGCDSDMCYFRFSNAAGDITDAMSPAPTPPAIGTPDATKKIVAYYVLPGATAYDNNATCTTTSASWHGTHTSGTVVGDNYSTLSTPISGGHNGGDGMAPNAKLIFQDAGDSSGCLSGLAFDNYLIFDQARNAGARIHSNSWGSSANSAYTNDSALVDRYMYDREDFLLVFSNGNDGPSATTVGSPATAKNCLSVGALSNGSAGSNSMASFSSRGPCLDGRRKPDVSAPGSSVVSALGDTSHTTNNCSTQSMSGTSMACPTVAGGSTLLRQYLTDGFYPTGVSSAADAYTPSGALMKAMVLNGAVQYTYTTQATVLNGLTPDMNQGWGRMLLDTVLFFSTPTRDARRVRVWDKWNATGLTTGQVDTFAVQVAAGQAFKVTLAWTDPQASASAAIQLVNNLDLEIVAPDGTTTYLGNQFSGGQSVTGGTADAINNVEEFFQTTPANGTWTVRVKATAVPGTPVQLYSTRQGYALVATFADCTNALTAPATLSAADNGTTGVDLYWGSVAGATGYQLYRANGNCTAAGSDFHFLGQSSTTTFTDTLVEGGYSYAYMVRAVTACTEGGLSPCASATFSGNCRMYPTFAGLGSVTNDTATAMCDMTLAWPAAASNCPFAETVSYNIYRGTSPYFTVGAASRLVAGVTDTSYLDNSVEPNATYYYVVRAEDGTTANGGPANGGNEDLNTLMKSGTPTAATVTGGIWSDAGGDSTLARLVLDPPWRVTNQQNHTTGGSLSYHSASDGSTYPPMTCASASTPDILLQAGAPTLTYWVRYNLEYQWDGVVTEISTNSGGSWAVITPTPAYPGVLSTDGGSSTPINACGFPLTQQAFTGPDGNASLTAWTLYTHNLSSYASQTVRIRWRLSSDPGAEFDGFYLDDIQITLASVPDACTVCPDNPTAVDVTPDGSLTLCTGSSQTLTATLTGGSGPFTYQWTRDGADIGGASASTYNADDTGTHSYNCKASGNGCASAVTDALSTQITWQAAPAFAGVSAVTNPASSTCTLDLGWSAGSSVCPGTVTYKVYRSTSSPVSTVPGNIVASGLTGTTYSDAAGLVHGTRYYYVVRAVDGAAQEDSNAVEMSGVPTGAISTSTVFTEGFDGTTFPPTGWTLTDVSGTAANWARVTTSTNPTGISPHDATTAMAELNSYHAASGTSARMARTANISIPAGTTIASAVLWVYHETGYVGYTDQIQVQTSPDGTTWSNRGTAINRYDGSTGWKQHVVDLSALIGAGNFQIGYLGVSDYGNDTYMDDVSLDITTASTCATGSVAPGETAPGDTSATAQSWTDKTTQTWPATATATSYTLYRGIQSDLPQLLNSSTDSCTKYAGAATSTDTITEDPTGIAGGFYWYLVTGSNTGGEGPAGNATAGPRTVDSSGTCP